MVSRAGESQSIIFGYPYGRLLVASTPQTFYNGCLKASCAGGRKKRRQLMQRASIKISPKRHILVVILMCLVSFGSFLHSSPTAYAAVDITATWSSATTIRVAGNALRNPVSITGDFVGNVFGTPAGSQSFLATASSPVEMSFGCTSLLTVNIYPDSAGKLDFTKGQLILTTGGPATCSPDQLTQNISGLSPPQNGGNADLAKSILVAGVINRGGGTGGNTSPATINVVAGMGPASDFTGLPTTDTFILCASTGTYANNKDALDRDCLAKKGGTVTKGPLTSHTLETLKDHQGPNNGDEKAWRGTFSGVKPGNYVVCSVNFNACQFFNAAGGQNATVRIEWGGAPNAKIPGTAPDSDSSTVNEPELGCDLTFDLTKIFSLKWLVCPIVNAATFTVGKFEDAINGLLTIDTKDIFNDTNTSNGYHKAWNSFRLFALGLIVIAALIMVVSQAAGIEILDAYTIRKVLPRLLFAAIFITLSWDILEFLANLSNDAGNGVRTLIYAPFQALNKKNQLGGGSQFVLTLIGTGGALAFGWIGLLSFAVTGLLAALVAFAVLVFRKMVILLLLMMAPFAIACYILPTTVKGWTIWKDGLLSVLVVFPIISGMIAIGRVFSITSFNTPAFNGPGGQTISQIIAVIAYFAPYFLISLAFRLAGGFIATVGGLANDRSRGAFDRLKNFRGNKASQNMSRMASGTRFQNNNPLARGFNAATGGAGAFAKSRSKLGFLTDKNVRQKAFAQQRFLNAMAYGNTDQAKVAAENDPLLRAQTYASEAEARRSMAQDWGLKDSDVYGTVQQQVDNSIAAAKANGGFGRDQQINAARRLFSTGTGYDNIRQVHETISRVAGDNSDIASDILGFGNAETGNKGRHDLKSGYTKHMELYNQIRKNGHLSDAEVKSGVRAAIEGNDAVTMLRDKKISMDNVAPVIAEDLLTARDTANDTSQTIEARDKARVEAGRLSGIVEQYQQNGTYAAPANVQVIDDVTVRPTVQVRQTVQQEASPTVLQVNPLTGRQEQVTNLTVLQGQLRDSQDLLADAQGRLAAAQSAGNAQAMWTAQQEVNTHQQAIQATTQEMQTRQQNGTLNQGLVNLRHDEDTERGYQQQKPRNMYDPNDPRFQQ